MTQATTIEAVIDTFRSDVVEMMRTLFNEFEKRVSTKIEESAASTRQHIYTALGYKAVYYE